MDTIVCNTSMDRMDKFMKKILKMILIILLFTFRIQCSVMASETEDKINTLFQWIEENGGIAENTDGDGTTDWYVFGGARYGYDMDYDKYLDSLERYLSENQIHTGKATEYHRIALVVSACGENPCDFAGENLIKEGVYGRSEENPLDAQGINGLIFGLIALDSGDYEIPKGVYYTREEIVKEILAKQLPDGGFALYGEEADADITAMAVQALAPYYNDSRGIKVKDEVDRALKALSDIQLPDGGYESGNIPNSESCAQVIVALCSLGMDPCKKGEFLKNGNSVVDALFQYQTVDGGFSHILNEEADWVAGSQALYAMVSLYRYQNELSSLYDVQLQKKSDTTGYNYIGAVLTGIFIMIFLVGAAGVIVYVKVGKKKKNM